MTFLAGPRLEAGVSDALSLPAVSMEPQPGCHLSADSPTCGMSSRLDVPLSLSLSVFSFFLLMVHFSS